MCRSTILPHLEITHIHLLDCSSVPLDTLFLLLGKACVLPVSYNDNKQFFLYIRISHELPHSKVECSSLFSQHLFPSVSSWGDPALHFFFFFFTTTGPEKSHHDQNELYHCETWPLHNLSACVVGVSPACVYNCPCSVFKVDLSASNPCQVCVA